MVITPTYDDTSFYFYHGNYEKIIGLTGVYVDASFYCDTPDFHKHSKRTLCKVKYRDHTFNNFRLAGISFRHETDGIGSHENLYLEFIDPISAHCTFSKFSSHREYLSAISHTRSDVSFDSASGTPETQETFQTNQPNFSKKPFVTLI